MDNSEKVGKYGTQDEEKQNKNTTQYDLDTNIPKHTQITQITHEPGLQITEPKSLKLLVAVGCTYLSIKEIHRLG